MAGSENGPSVDHRSPFIATIVLVSSIDNGHELDDEAVALLAVASLIARQAFVWFSGEGVRIEHGLATGAGFHSVPKAMALLPRDVMRYETRHHSGVTSRAHLGLACQPPGTMTTRLARAHGHGRGRSALPWPCPPSPRRAWTASRLLTADLPIAGLQIVQAQVTVAPGRREGRHVHAGTLVEHVVGGEMTLELPDTPTKVLTAGQSVLIDTGVNGRRVRAVRPSATGRPPLTTGGKVPGPD